MTEQKDAPKDEQPKGKGFWHSFGQKLADIGLSTLGAYLQGKVGGGR